LLLAEPCLATQPGNIAVSRDDAGGIGPETPSQLSEGGEAVDVEIGRLWDQQRGEIGQSTRSVSITECGIVPIVATPNGAAQFIQFQHEYLEPPLVIGAQNPHLTTRLVGSAPYFSRYPRRVRAWQCG